MYAHHSTPPKKIRKRQKGAGRIYARYAHSLGWGFEGHLAGPATSDRRHGCVGGLEMRVPIGRETLPVASDRVGSVGADGDMMGASSQKPHLVVRFDEHTGGEIGRVNYELSRCLWGIGGLSSLSLLVNSQHPHNKTRVCSFPKDMEHES